MASKDMTGANGRMREIYKSVLNGQLKQAVESIDGYGVYDFFPDFAVWLAGLEMSTVHQYSVFRELVIAYHHIKGR